MNNNKVEMLINFHQANNNSQNNLWLMYVAATMAAAGFGFSSSSLQLLEGILASIGFTAFTIGQGVMVFRAITIQDAIESQLRDAADNEYITIINTLVNNSMTKLGALKTHIPIDLCVVGIIMYKPILAILR